MPYGFRVAFVKIRRGSNMAIFTGAGVAIVTPFKEDESIDYDRLDELIDFHCENGTDSIVICGTSGEAATMTEREHMECVKFIRLNEQKEEFRLSQEPAQTVRRRQWNYQKKPPDMAQTACLS